MLVENSILLLDGLFCIGTLEPFSSRNYFVAEFIKSSLFEPYLTSKS